MYLHTLFQFKDIIDRTCWRCIYVPLSTAMLIQLETCSDCDLGLAGVKDIPLRGLLEFQHHQRSKSPPSDGLLIFQRLTNCVDGCEGQSRQLLFPMISWLSDENVRRRDSRLDLSSTLSAFFSHCLLFGKPSALRHAAIDRRSLQR